MKTSFNSNSETFLLLGIYLAVRDTLDLGFLRSIYPKFLGESQNFNLAFPKKKYEIRI